MKIELVTQIQGKQVTGIAGAKALSDTGDPQGLTLLGHWLMTGFECAPDPELAGSLYEQAACQGYGPAMVALGQLYQRGCGVPADEAAARRWFLAAREAGSYEAEELCQQLAAPSVEPPEPAKLSKLLLAGLDKPDRKTLAMRLRLLYHLSAPGPQRERLPELIRECSDEQDPTAPLTALELARLSLDEGNRGSLSVEQTRQYLEQLDGQLAQLEERETAASFAQARSDAEKLKALRTRLRERKELRISLAVSWEAACTKELCRLQQQELEEKFEKAQQNYPELCALHKALRSDVYEPQIRRDWEERVFEAGAACQLAQVRSLMEQIPKLDHKALVSLYEALPERFALDPKGLEPFREQVSAQIDAMEQKELAKLCAHADSLDSRGCKDLLEALAECGFRPANTEPYMESVKALQKNAFVLETCVDEQLEEMDAERLRALVKAIHFCTLPGKDKERLTGKATAYLTMILECRDKKTLALLSQCEPQDLQNQTREQLLLLRRKIMDHGYLPQSDKERYAARIDRVQKLSELDETIEKAGSNYRNLQMVLGSLEHKALSSEDVERYTQKLQQMILESKIAELDKKLENARGSESALKNFRKELGEYKLPQRQNEDYMERSRQLLRQYYIEETDRKIRQAGDVYEKLLRIYRGLPDSPLEEEDRKVFALRLEQQIRDAQKCALDTLTAYGPLEDRRQILHRQEQAQGYDFVPSVKDEAVAVLEVRVDQLEKLHLEQMCAQLPTMDEAQVDKTLQIITKLPYKQANKDQYLEKCRTCAKKLQYRQLCDRCGFAHIKGLTAQQLQALDEEFDAFADENTEAYRKLLSMVQGRREVLDRARQELYLSGVPQIVEYVVALAPKNGDVYLSGESLERKRSGLQYPLDRTEEPVFVLDARPATQPLTYGLCITNRHVYASAKGSDVKAVPIETISDIRSGKFIFENLVVVSTQGKFKCDALEKSEQRAFAADLSLRIVQYIAPILAQLRQRDSWLFREYEADCARYCQAYLPVERPTAPEPPKTVEIRPEPAQEPVRPANVGFKPAQGLDLAEEPDPVALAREIQRMAAQTGCESIVLPVGSSGFGQKISQALSSYASVGRDEQLLAVYDSSGTGDRGFVLSSKNVFIRNDHHKLCLPVVRISRFEGLKNGILIHTDKEVLSLCSGLSQANVEKVLAFLEMALPRLR